MGRVLPSVRPGRCLSSPGPRVALSVCGDGVGGWGDSALLAGVANRPGREAERAGCGSHPRRPTSPPGRKDHSVNKMCASSCDFVKRHFFSDYLMGFINSGILKVDVDCCGGDLCNGGLGVGGSPWALAGGLLLSLGPTVLGAGP